MKRLLALVTGIAAGAVVMYMLDPTSGRRRRALVRDKAVATGHDVERLARGTTRQTANHVRGVAAKVRTRMRRSHPDDDQLRDHIRSRLGHTLHHPARVEVKVDHGQVVLTGTADPAEMEQLVATISKMQGVHGVENRLTAEG
ncbi:MAG TPA: BON domain-containing protein [Rhodanobacteraceae bacterium]